MVDMSKMTTVYMGLLKRGPRAAEWDARPEELAKLQEAHLANNARLVQSASSFSSAPSPTTATGAASSSLKSIPSKKPKPSPPPIPPSRPAGWPLNFTPG